MNFAERIFEFRVANNLTQLKVSEILSIDQASVSMYESGKRKPNKRNEVRFERIMQEYERSKK